MKLINKKIKFLFITLIISLNSFIECNRVSSSISKDLNKSKSISIPLSPFSFSKSKINFNEDQAKIVAEIGAGKKPRLYRKPATQTASPPKQTTSPTISQNSVKGDTDLPEDDVEDLFENYFSKKPYQSAVAEAPKSKIPDDISPSEAESASNSLKLWARFPLPTDADYNYKNKNCDYAYNKYSEQMTFSPSIANYIGHCYAMTKLLSEVQAGTNLQMMAVATESFYKALPKDFCYKAKGITECPAGYTECKPGCAASGWTCALTVLKLFYKLVKFGINLFLHISTAGLSGLLQNIFNHLTTNGWGYVSAGFDVALTFLGTLFKIIKVKSTDQDAFIKRMVKIATIDHPNIPADAIKPYCETVFNGIRDKYSDQYQAWKGGWKSKLDLLWKTVKTLPVDPTPTQNLLNDCQTPGIDCVKSIIGGFGKLDPTGILSLVSSFMYSICPTEDYELKYFGMVRGEMKKQKLKMILKNK